MLGEVRALIVYVLCTKLEQWAAALRCNRRIELVQIILSVKKAKVICDGIAAFRMAAPRKGGREHDLLRDP
jgi:hypothetical protein